MVNIVKLKDMRERTISELQEEIIKTRKEIFEYKLNKSLQKLENTSLISKAKNKIAQLKTVISEKQKQEVIQSA